MNEQQHFSGKLKTLEERYGKVAEIAKRYRGQVGICLALKIL